MPSPDFRHAEAGESAEAFALRCAAAVEAHFRQHAGTTAAFILEPLVQGAAGMAMYHPVYLSQVHELCAKYEVHLIADEIAVGFGRTGTMFACEQANIKPDFMCLSKGISGGYLPLSCVLTTEDIYAAFYAVETAKGFLHSHSYTGNPLACRAALAALDIFEDDGVIAANRGKAELFSRLLQPVREHARVRHFRHRGMIWAFDVTDAKPGFARDFYRGALEQGVLLRPIGGTVYFMPPYVIEEAHMRQMARATEALLNTIKQ
jgi:adenosylmethionine-8-amino-7-oxononanoate aminotransferase